MVNIGFFGKCINPVMDFGAFFPWEYGNHLCTHPYLTVRSTFYRRGAVGPEWMWPPSSATLSTVA